MGLCCCVRAFSSCVLSFSSCSKWGLPLSSCGVSRLLTVVACCTAWTLGPEGLAAPPHVESSWKVKAAQWCLTLCELMDSTVHGILQARILEWVAFPFSQLRDSTLQADSLPAEPQGKLPWIKTRFKLNICLLILSFKK